MGAAVSTGGQFLRVLVNVGAIVILSRLLAPEDFGLLAMAGVAIGVSNLFAEIGLSAATVQRREMTDRIVNGLFFVNLGLGLLAMALLLAGAPLIAAAFGEPKLTVVVMVLAVSVPLTAASRLQTSLLQRRMQWWAIESTSVAAQVTGAALAIALAVVTDAGHWALVAQICGQAVMLLLLVSLVCPWRPGLDCDWRETRDCVAFGANLTAFNVINLAQRQGDDALIGWRWGAEELGYYSRAYTVLTLPITMINQPVGAAVIPALSRLQDAPDLWRRAYLESLSAVMLISTGFAAVLITVAEPLILLLLGPEWRESAEIFGILALSIFFSTPLNTLSWIYISLGRGRRMLHWGMIATPTIILAFALGLEGGASGVAWAYVSVLGLLLLPGMHFAMAATPLGLRDGLSAIATPMLAGGLSAAAGAGLQAALTLGEGPLAVIVLALGVGLTHLLLATAALALDPSLGSLRRRAMQLAPWQAGRDA